MVTIVPYSHVLILAAILFLLGAGCAVARRNLIMILIGVEVMLSAAGLALVGASLRWQQLDGQAFVIFIMARGGLRSGGGPGPDRLFPAAHRHGGCGPLQPHEGLTWKPFSCSYCSFPWAASSSTPSWAGCCPGGSPRSSPAPRSWGPWSWPLSPWSWPGSRPMTSPSSTGSGSAIFPRP